MFLRNINRFYLAAVIILIIAAIAAIKFDKFSFSFSNGKMKTEVKGEQNQDVNRYHEIPSTSKESTVSPDHQIIQTTTTKGGQSPAINNSNSTSTINYGTK